MIEHVSNSNANTISLQNDKNCPLHGEKGPHKENGPTCRKRCYKVTKKAPTWNFDFRGGGATLTPPPLRTPMEMV